jgi:hypothetical protein
MSPILNVKRFAAFDTRTGKRLGPPRFTERLAGQDAKRIGRKHKGEVVPMPVEEDRA